MGVDWLTCGICEDTFPDCGECYNCAGCEDDICTRCHDLQTDKYETVDEDSEEAEDWGESALKECDSCTKSIIRDDDIVSFLLHKYNLDKDSVVDEIKKLKENNEA